MYLTCCRVQTWIYQKERDKLPVVSASMFLNPDLTKQRIPRFLTSRVAGEKVRPAVLAGLSAARQLQRVSLLRIVTRPAGHITDPY